MSPHRVSDSTKPKVSRFPARVPKMDVEVDEVSLTQRTKDLGLSQIDSSFAIGQSGGVVVVMQELHNESAHDTGDFVAVQSKFDKRKQAQLDREELERKRRADEKKAAIALKKAEEVREAEAAKAVADALAAEVKREADLKKEEARRAKQQAYTEKMEAEKKEAEKKKEIELKAKAAAAAAAAAAQAAELAAQAAVQPPSVPASIMRDSAIMNVGNVIKKVTRLGSVRRDAECQTDPVRILPIVEPPVVHSLQSMVGTHQYTNIGNAPASIVGPGARPGAAAAAWWLQQVTPQSQAAAPNEFLMYPQQAPPQASSYYYQNNDQMYWQNAYGGATRR